MFVLECSAMKPEWEFLTKSIYDPGIFWVMVTAVATLCLVILAAIPLRDLARARRTELVRHLKDDFVTPQIKAIMFLLNHNLIEYREDPRSTPFFSFARISNDPAQGRIRETLGDRVVLSAFEVDDDLLNPLEEVAVLAFAKSIAFEDVYALFGTFMKSTVENEAIQKHVRDVRRNQGAANAWMNLERIVPILNRLDDKFLRRLARG
jgi:hypothetical protein